jgi:hypothetical protein
MAPPFSEWGDPTVTLAPSYPHFPMVEVPEVSLGKQVATGIVSIDDIWIEDIRNAVGGYQRYDSPIEIRNYSSPHIWTLTYQAPNLNTNMLGNSENSFYMRNASGQPAYSFDLFRTLLVFGYFLVVMLYSIQESKMLKKGKTI